MAPKKIFVQSDSGIVELPFTDCVLDVMGVEDDGCNISIEMHDDCLILSKVDDHVSELSENSFVGVMRHSAVCPLREFRLQKLSGISESAISRGIAIAVAVLLQTKDNFVLLTKRATHMRTFPDCWVPPGGHVDPNETLKSAVARELMEEIGLEMDTASSSLKILGVWESIYPPVLAWGMPNRHHIIVYFLYVANETHDELQRKLKLEAAEVSASIWVDPVLAATLMIGDMSKLIHLSPSREVTLVGLDEAQRISQVPVEELFSFDGPPVSRITVGTRFALERWLSKIEISTNLDNGSTSSTPAHL